VPPPPMPCASVSLPSVLQYDVRLWQLFICRSVGTEQFQNYMHAILTQVRIPKYDKLLLWLVLCLLCSRSSFICLDGWGKKIPQITWRHLPQDITMSILLLRLHIVLVMFVCIRSIFLRQPGIAEGNTPNSTPTFQKYLLQRPNPMAARSKA
jgi:hypothetical protein